MAESSYFNIFVTHVVDAIDYKDSPSLCNLIFCGQKNRDVALKLDEQIKACSFDTCPEPTPSDLKREKIFCVLLNNIWVRAEFHEMAKDSFGYYMDVYCIDYGSIQSIPLNFCRVIPPHARSIADIHCNPPLAFKFLLADVLTANGPKGKESALLYLKQHMENKIVKAVPLGAHNGFEGVRVYLNDQLVAKLLVENNIGKAATTYNTALQTPVPTKRIFFVESVTPLEPHAAKHFPTRKSSSSCSTRSIFTPAINGNLSYTQSFLEANGTHFVTVTDVHNGPAKFAIQRNSPEAEESMKLISKHLSNCMDANPKALTVTLDGTPCIALSGRDKEFHRGLITSSANDGQYFRVYFVDQGYTDVVSLNFLYEIPPALVTLELQAIRVGLDEAESLLIHNGVSQIFTKLVIDKIFRCKVVNPSIPQTVVLYDGAGRSVKDLVLDCLNHPNAVRSVLSLNIQQVSAPASPIPALIRADLKVDRVEVEPEERLFVTHTGTLGEFFGQFEKRPEMALKELEAELLAVYCSNPGTSSDIPLLYADVYSHIGDYGVIQWSADGNLYRVKIIDEDANQANVSFIDYGNKIQVSRRAIWAPVQALKLFTQQPFGIDCIVSDVKGYTVEEWRRHLTDKSIHVKLGPGIKGVYPAKLPGDFLKKNNHSNVSHKSSCLSPVAPEWIPSVNGIRPLTEMSRKLSFDSSAPPTVVLPPLKVTYPAPAPTQSTSNGSVAQSTVFTVKKTGGLMVEAERPRTTSFSSMTSKNSTNQDPTDDWESVEKRVSPKRDMPIAHPIQYVYPPQPGLEGLTKILEVVFVESPSSFYCHLAEGIPILDALMEKISTSYTDESKPALVDPKEGVACVAKYTGDGAWYRGKILHVEGTTEVEILFVDYGNKEKTPIDLIKAIEEEFVGLPPQAYHCSMSGVFNTIWTAEETIRFEGASLSKRLTGTFAKQRLNEQFTVRLVEECNGTPIVINELFKSPVPSPEDSEFPTLPLSEEPIDVSVAWYYSPFRFFLSPTDVSSYQDDLDQLENFYSPLSSDDMVEDQPKVGLPCVVRFKEDDRYYRSRILSIQGQIAEVLFVDYGNEQDTPLKDLKRIHPQFMKCPQLTWQCALKDVKVRSSLTPESKKHIDKCFLSLETPRALIYPPSDGVFGAVLNVPGVGDVTEYLMSHKVVESTIVEEKTVLVPQNLNFKADEVLSKKSYLTFTKSPMEFWVQLEPDAVEAFMAQIDELALKPEFINEKKFVPSIGGACLAFSTEDSRWYRATIHEVDSDTSTVYYIDYGNCSSVSNDQLRRLPANFAQQPPMAFKCCLDGVKEVSKEVKDAFELLAMDLEATVTFVEAINGCLQVRLSYPNGDDVAEKIGLPAKSKEMDVYVAYSTTPTSFWIQLTQDGPKLTEIQDILYEELHGSKAESHRIQGLPTVGEVYGVNHPEYQSWYRGQLKSLANNFAEVHFIDYGDTHRVPITDICRLPDRLKGVAPIAIESSLNLDLGEKEMPEEACKYFNAVCPDVVCQIVLGSKLGNIQLIDEMKTSTENILEVVKGKIQSSRLRNVVENLVGILDPSSKALQSEDYQTIRSCSELLSDADCFPGKLISSNASAVCLTSPSSVWLHLDSSAADEVTDSIQQYVNQPEFAKLPVLEPMVGCSCLALFSDDNSWYRAIVESVAQDSVVVNYVDYGNSSTVGRDQLRALPPSLVKQPTIALKCALDGVERSPDNLPSTADCQAAIFNQTLSVTFIEKTEKHIFVRLRDAAGTDLNEKLGLPARKMDSAPAADPINQQVIQGGVVVTVSHIKSAGMFWIQKKDDEDALEQIRDVLRPLDRDEPGNVAAVNVRENDLCAVMHPDYNRYYRARINKIEGEDVEAFFLDYGHTHWVPKANVRNCPVILKYIPAMAVECSFRTPVYPDQYSDEIQKAFSDATEGVECQAVFSGPQPAHGVHHVEALYAKGVNVANLLSSSALAAQAAANTGRFDNRAMFSSKQQRGL